MDGDGEDKPQDIPALLAQFHREAGEKIIFAERTKRMESRTFQFFYAVYRIVHLALTGHAVRVGNFSVLPRSAVDRLVVVAEIWNHYSAAVFRSRIPYSTLPLARGSRLSGKSQMNFIALVIHGLSAISVFGDIVGGRLLAMAVLLIVFASAGIGAVGAVKLWTDLAIPGWATGAVGVLTVILLQAVSISFLLVFFILGSRAQASFLPLRDCPYFIKAVRTLVDESEPSPIRRY